MSSRPCQAEVATFHSNSLGLLHVMFYIKEKISYYDESVRKFTMMIMVKFIRENIKLFTYFTVTWENMSLVRWPVDL